jgi:hypothetical protein
LQQSFSAVRFAQVVICPSIKIGNPVCDQVMTNEEEYGKLPATLPEVPTGVKPQGGFGVEDNQARWGSFELLPAVRLITRQNGLKASAP